MNSLRFNLWHYTFYRSKFLALFSYGWCNRNKISVELAMATRWMHQIENKTFEIEFGARASCMLIAILNFSYVMVWRHTVRNRTRCIFVHLYGISDRNSRQLVKFFCCIKLFNRYWCFRCLVCRIFCSAAYISLRNYPFLFYSSIIYIFVVVVAAAVSFSVAWTVRIYNSVWFTLLHSYKTGLTCTFPFQRYQLAHWAFCFMCIDSSFR